MAQLLRLLRLIKPYRGRIAGSLLCMAVVAGFELLVISLIRPLLDDGLFAKPEAMSEGTGPFRLMVALGNLGLVGEFSAREAIYWWIGSLALLGLVATALKGLAKYGADYLVGYVGLRVINDLREALFRRLQSLSLGFFQERKTGELLSRVIVDVGAMQSMMERLFGPALSAIIQILALSVFLLVLNWKLAILALLLFPVAVWPIRNFGLRLRMLSRQVQDTAAELAGHLEETLSQIKLVKAYQGEERETKRWAGKLEEQLRVALGSLRVRARSTPIMETIGALGFAGLVLYSGYEILFVGAMTGGGLVMFLGGVLKLYPNIKNLNGLWTNIQIGLGAADRVFPLLDERPGIQDAPDARPLASFNEAIEYEKVSFAYRKGEPVLHEITLKILRGQRVAFVGPSGAGKTTLLDLLLRFHDPGGGRIVIDGRDLRTLSVESLRRQIALVSQEVLLFNATARENLLYARPGATENEMAAAARAAGAHEFVMALPEKYDTLIGERGAKLSGGERQRLSIARAFLKDSPILILDEATAALDAASEEKVQRALESLMANRTVLIIAHRLATVRKADRIVVLQNGRIVDDGTHEGLLNRGGLYRDLYDLQFKGASLKTAD